MNPLPQVPIPRPDKLALVPLVLLPDKPKIRENPVVDTGYTIPDPVITPGLTQPQGEIIDLTPRILKLPPANPIPTEFPNPLTDLGGYMARVRGVRV